MTERRTNRPAADAAAPAYKDRDPKRNVHQRLLAVQAEVKGPRGQRGKFGASRSAESLLAEAKPVAVKHGLLITADAGGEIDELERRYVVITLTATNVDDPSQQIVCKARAWEGDPELTRDGRPINDPPQVTGKSDSYALKFALQHLLAIGGEGDPDVDDQAPAGEQQSQRPTAARKASKQAPPPEPALGEGAATGLVERAQAVGRDLGGFLQQRYGHQDLARLTASQAKTVDAWLASAEKAAGAAPQTRSKAGNGQAGRSVPKGGASSRRTDLTARVLALSPDDRVWFDAELTQRQWPTDLAKLSDEQVTAVFDEVLSALADE